MYQPRCDPTYTPNLSFSLSECEEWAFNRLGFTVKPITHEATGSPHTWPITDKPCLSGCSQPMSFWVTQTEQESYFIGKIVHLLIYWRQNLQLKWVCLESGQIKSETNECVGLFADKIHYMFNIKLSVQHCHWQTTTCCIFKWRNTNALLIQDDTKKLTVEYFLIHGSGYSDSHDLDWLHPLILATLSDFTQFSEGLKYKKKRWNTTIKGEFNLG